MGVGVRVWADCRLECILPQAALDELKRRKTATGIYRTRIAVNILCDELIGGVVASSRAA